MKDEDVVSDVVRFERTIDLDNIDNIEPEPKKDQKKTLNYSIEENPPWYLVLLLGFQHYLTMCGSSITVPLVLAPFLCVNDGVIKGKLISTVFVMSGISTLMQTIFGTRLPIIQGGSFSYLASAIAILTTSDYECPTGFSENPQNSTYDGIWKRRMLEIQGAIMVSSFFQMFLGFTGLVGFLLRFIGPITVAPTISLVGLSLYGACSSFAGQHWGIASLTIGVMIICSLFLDDVKMPLPFYTKSKGFFFKWTYLFKLFPVVIAVITSWIFCLVLTASGVFQPGSKARTDSRLNVLSDTPWFIIPYPGQWGRPTVSVASVFGMLAALIAGIVESIGDYYACANICGAPPPPKHAVNRGIAIEGITCFLTGSVGTGSGMTSFSENIAALGITKVGSRRVIQVGALCMVFLGVLGKFGALFSTIPDPVVGGVFCCMFGMITAVGISNLQYADMNSLRNLFIVGFAFLMGFTVPDYFKKHKNAIDTGITEIDQIFTIILTTGMGVGGLTSVILDNLVPGTREERGMIKWRQKSGVKETDVDIHVYDLPFGIGNNWKIAKYLPFLPYHGNNTNPQEIPLNTIETG